MGCAQLAVTESELRASIRRAGRTLAPCAGGKCDVKQSRRFESLCVHSPACPAPPSTTDELGVDSASGARLIPATSRQLTPASKFRIARCCRPATARVARSRRRHELLWRRGAQRPLRSVTPEPRLHHRCCRPVHHLSHHRLPRQRRRRHRPLPLRVAGRRLAPEERLVRNGRPVAGASRCATTA